MIQFVSVKALAGVNYVRADHVIAVAASEPTKCNIVMAGGVTVPCAEPAKDVIARLESATSKETGNHDGDGRP
ncbi:MAG TPA: hypothetical protein VKS78_13505 [Roseiarcus sp.]|nr:hypothetical protein [Roseiarcus sp.]